MMNLITEQLRDQRPPVPSSPSAAAKPAAGVGFGRLLAEIRDVLNPLQHLPVLSGLYRALSKDQISPTANLLGGLVYGGPIGAAVAMVQNLANRIAGKDLMASAWQRVVGNPAPPESPRPDKAIASAPGHAPLAPPAAARRPRPPGRTCAEPCAGRGPRKAPRRSVRCWRLQSAPPLARRTPRCPLGLPPAGHWPPAR